MNDIGIEAVRSRVDSLVSRFNGDQSVRSLGSTAEFDPFGASYQAALAHRDSNGIEAPSVSTVGVARMSTSLSSSLAMSGSDRDAILAAISGSAAPSGARPVGGYGSMPIPDELRGYGNGKIPSEALTQLDQGSHKLYAPAAFAWNSLVASARADGINLTITDSYRSYEEQVDLVRRKGLYSEGGLAATPGTSNHGWGLAVDADVTDPETRAWLQQNGPRFGWVEAVPREPWHWEFRPNQV